ncbi:UDP-N-acetylglucosamine 1-carboxyvinyltransferase [Truepera radiovictrix]|uniref:UDP-N-acetylglucosamine 1-carboxyvinyltransferase n=1 Tax=Truepera radiovictrix (strain DSM 17093 / CIP 108686 / LMG 22925 / RQ-24) TaxID=649638 RepID=D7CSW0_TRURR|nr:UDP-N-acetylglucosamine 1-carboxyvinyltransferase [Truepera radiovictrix]ADI13727.1 UDP-N-acetylglucosamine1-carboxyvinyltransferase [Truepera radiovictrix DSM 17093]WMT57708.1 UDP-N-acetylglucosamine 1-carboxyvinyltransferase [Truepera radiovictrix]
MELHHDAFFVTGGVPLRGEVGVHAAKNSALYLMLGALLTRDEVVLEEVPQLSDILALCDLLRHFGARVTWRGRDLHLDAAKLVTCEAPYALVSPLRASFVAMGALLGRCGEAHMSMPGGCAFGPRPVDRHIKAFRQLGVAFEETKGDFHARRLQPLRGRVLFDAPTVGGTQNVILASAVGSERVIIENAALEPEIADLAAMLNGMGARIAGAGTPTITIDGVSALSGTRYRPLPDRIEAGTLMLAAAATRGRVTLTGARAEHLRAVIAKLEETGVRVCEEGPERLSVDATGSLKPTDITALEYPGLPTDLQAPFGAFLATIPGRSVVTDRVYPDRFTHVGELARTGAQLELDGRTLVIHGGVLRGATMHAADIRAGGALVIAALAAHGDSTITGVQYIRRGYERLAERLNLLGARVRLGAAPALAAGLCGD